MVFLLDINILQRTLFGCHVFVCIKVHTVLHFPRLQTIVIIVSTSNHHQLGCCHVYESIDNYDNVILVNGMQHCTRKCRFEWAVINDETIRHAIHCIKSTTKTIDSNQDPKLDKYQWFRYPQLGLDWIFMIYCRLCEVVAPRLCGQW